MIELILSIYLGYRNSILAKQKGQNVTLWAVVTILAYFLSMMAGGVILFVLFYNGGMNQAAIQNFTIQFMTQPLRIAFVYFCGVGGFLLVKYILERMPDMPVKETNGE